MDIVIIRSIRNSEKHSFTVLLTDICSIPNADHDDGCYYLISIQIIELIHVQIPLIIRVMIVVVIHVQVSLIVRVVIVVAIAVVHVQSS